MLDKEENGKLLLYYIFYNARRIIRIFINPFIGLYSFYFFFHCFVLYTRIYFSARIGVLYSLLLIDSLCYRLSLSLYVLFTAATYIPVVICMAT